MEGVMENLEKIQKERGDREMGKGEIVRGVIKSLAVFDDADIALTVLSHT